MSGMTERERFSLGDVGNDGAGSKAYKWRSRTIEVAMQEQSECSLGDII